MMSKIIKKVPFMFVLLILAITLFVGCKDRSDDTEYIPRTQPLYSWEYTDDGQVQYRWTDDGSCIIKSFGHTRRIPRTLPRGSVAGIVWQWEEDGDVDIRINGNKYDLDSPFDFDDEDTEHFARDSYLEEDDSGGMVGGLIAGAGIGHLLSKKKHKVYGYDVNGNPLDKKGKIIPAYDKKGKPVKLYDTKGKAIKPTKGTAGNTFTPYSNPSALEKENAALKAKSKRQAEELKRQQAANKKKKTSSRSKVKKSKKR